jgi:glycerol uptake facilitator-like aquaporin
MNRHISELIGTFTLVFFGTGAIVFSVVSGPWWCLWLYLVGPVVGALAAVPTCRILQAPDCCVAGEQGDAP